MPIAVAVVLYEGFVLVGRRERPPFAGLAEFPGGKVRADESPEAAAAREAREECGIAVRVERLLSSVAADSPHGRLDLRFYLCRLCPPAAATEVLPAPAAPPRSAETTAGPSTPPPPAEPPLPSPPFRWLPLQEVGHLDFPPANAAALRALRTLGG